VTISGYRFGSSTGTVYFTGAGDTLIPASVPDACDPTTAWQDQQVVVQVPLDAVDGPVTLDTADGRRVVSSQSFDVIDDTLRPGLCAVDPDSAVPGGSITAPDGASNPDSYGIFGVRFGDAGESATPAGAGVLLGDTEAALGNATWSDTRIDGAAVPETLAENQNVLLAVRGEQSATRGESKVSNAVDFDIAALQRSSVIIDQLFPDHGPVGTYLRIAGSGFGETAGTVWFVDPSDPTVLTPGGTDFPAACAASRWSAAQILVKVPPGLSTSTYNVVVQTSEGEQSQAKPFLVTGEAIGPQICLVDPDNGPTGTQAAIHGENFGTFGTGDTVRFSAGTTSIAAAVSADAWTAQRIGLVVPSGLTDGIYDLTVTDDGRVSAPVSFTVGSCFTGSLQCGDAETCCAPGFCSTACVAQSGEYAWRFRTDDAHPRVQWQYPTGALPVGSDPDGVQVAFDRVMDTSTFRLAQGSVSDPTIYLQICNGDFAGGECADNAWLNLPATGTLSLDTLADEQNNAVGFSLQPFPDVPEDLLTKSQVLFRVVMTDQISSDNGFSLEGLNTNFGQSGSANAYSWTFTLDQTVLCVDANNPACTGITSCEGDQCADLYAPSSLAATMVDVTDPAAGIKLTWSDPNVGYPFIYSFRIERHGVDAAYQLLTTVTGGSTYVDLDVDPATTYTYRVAAVHATDRTPYSNEAALTTSCTTSDQCGADACCALQQTDPNDPNSPQAGSCFASTSAQCSLGIVCQDTSQELNGIDAGCSTASPCCGSTGQCSVATYDAQNNVTCTTPRSKVSNTVAFTALPGETTCETCLLGIEPGTSTWLRTVTLSGTKFGARRSGNAVSFAPGLLQVDTAQYGSPVTSWTDRGAVFGTTLDADGNQITDEVSVKVPVSPATRVPEVTVGVPAAVSRPS